MADNEFIKMSCVTVIQLLNEKLGIKQNFDILWKMNIRELEKLRDDLIPQYNKFIEGYEFTTKIIYNKSKSTKPQLIHKTDKSSKYPGIRIVSDLIGLFGPYSYTNKRKKFRAFKWITPLSSIYKAERKAKRLLGKYSCNYDLKISLNPILPHITICIDYDLLGGKDLPKGGIK